MNWLRQLFSRRRIYNELSEEIQEHLEEKVEELVAGGMSREEAMHVARKEFGNVSFDGRKRAGGLAVAVARRFFRATCATGCGCCGEIRCLPRWEC